MRYQYWHLITKSFDKEVKVGEYLSNKYKMDYKTYEVFNMRTGKTRKVCEVKYLCRTPTEWSNKKVIAFIKKKSAEMTKGAKK